MSQAFPSCGKNPEIEVKAPDSLLNRDVLDDILKNKQNSQEEVNYYKQLYTTEQNAWDKFHDILKSKGQSWWD